MMLIGAKFAGVDVKHEGRGLDYTALGLMVCPVRCE